jgi:hypothetical protein
MYRGILLKGPSNTLLIKVPESLTFSAPGTSCVTSIYKSDFQGVGSCASNKKSFTSVAACASCACSDKRLKVRRNIPGKGIWKNCGKLSLIKSLSCQICTFSSQGLGSNLGQQSSCWFFWLIVLVVEIAAVNIVKSCEDCDHNNHSLSDNRQAIAITKAKILLFLC